jgi:hypothetical protein
MCGENLCGMTPAKWLAKRLHVSEVEAEARLLAELLNGLTGIIDRSTAPRIGRQLTSFSIALAEKFVGQGLIL